MLRLAITLIGGLGGCADNKDIKEMAAPVASDEDYSKYNEKGQIKYEGFWDGEPVTYTNSTGFVEHGYVDLVLTDRKCLPSSVPAIYFRNGIRGEEASTCVDPSKLKGDLESDNFFTAKVLGTSPWP